MKTGFRARLQQYFRSAACYWPSWVLKHTQILLFALYACLSKDNCVVGWAWHAKAAYAIRRCFLSAAGGLPPARFPQIHSPTSPPVGGSRWGVRRGWGAQAAQGAHRNRGGGNHSQLPVHHSASISDLSQRAGSPRGPPGANITNHGIRSANNRLMCSNLAAERSNADCLFRDWRVF